MKSVLISIQPKWCELIANGKKTVEVRKTRPKLETPFRCYIYCTNTPKYHHLYDLTEYNFGKPLYSVTQHNKDSLVPNGYLNGKVIGEFVCDRIEKFTVGSLRCDDIEKLACLSYSKMIKYFYKPEELDGKTVKFGYAWHISDLAIYDKPKELGEFRKPCDWVYDCNTCKRALYEHKTNNFYGEEEFVGCDDVITRPFQSWGYVEEIF